MKNCSAYFVFMAILLCICACNGTGSVLTPTSSGLPYQILVVVEPDVWERPAGRALNSLLKSDIPGLPQPENTFTNVMYVAPKYYDSTMKMLRNIIIVDIQADKYTQAKFGYAKDVYATSQMILTIQTPNEEEFQTFVKERGKEIIDFFTRAEMNRQIVGLEKRHSDMISHKVDSMFNSEIWLSGELFASKTKEDFFWAGTNKATGDMNFVIYSYPYRDRNTFTKAYFVNKRDSVLKLHMPGAWQDSYMMTADTLLLETRAISVHDREYTFEARGLWRVKGDFMGGPFVSHSRVDITNNRVVTAEIFVYSPDGLKGNLVRRMEASLYTLKLPHERNKGENPAGNSGTQVEKKN